MKAETIKAPGATLYYEKYGVGPLLIMIPGGPADAGGFAGLAAQLQDRYTVIAYDPRGNSRSVFDSAPVDQDMDVHGDDAARIIDAQGVGPAFVLGSSGGAQIGLNLAARHPDRVRTLVAHEPPCTELLPDAAAKRAEMKELGDLYRAQGAGAAMAKFMANTGMDARHAGPPPNPSPEMIAMFGRLQKNFDYFFGHGLMPISTYVPDVAKLKSGKPRIVVGVGEATAGQTANRTGVALAEELGAPPVIFPGDHNGYGAHAPAFAAVLHRIFSEN